MINKMKRHPMECEKIVTNCVIVEHSILKIEKGHIYLNSKKKINCLKLSKTSK
jgi:hypothetical protein